MEPEIKKLVYKERLPATNLHTLEERRKKGDTTTALMFLKETIS